MNGAAWLVCRRGVAVLTGLIGRFLSLLLVPRRRQPGLIWRLFWTWYVDRTYDRPGGADKLRVVGPLILAGVAPPSPGEALAVGGSTKRSAPLSHSRAG